MSSAIARTLAPAPRRLEEAKAAGLRLVRPVRSRARKAPFVVVVMAVLAVGLVGLILMSTVLQAQSFEAAKLDRTAAQLEAKQQLIGREVDQLQSPANVARHALQLGMVPNENPTFLRLSDDKVLGEPKAAEAGNSIKSVTR